MFVLACTVYFFARIERGQTTRPPRQKRQAPRQRAPWTPPWTRRQRRHKDATPATQAAPDAAPDATPDATPKQRSSYTPAIEPDDDTPATDKKSASRWTLGTLKAAIPSRRSEERTIRIVIQDGAEETAELVQEAARRGWQAIRDTVSGDLALYDPKSKRVYAAKFERIRR